MVSAQGGVEGHFKSLLIWPLHLHLNRFLKMNSLPQIFSSTLWALCDYMWFNPEKMVLDSQGHFLYCLCKADSNTVSIFLCIFCIWTFNWVITSWTVILPTFCAYTLKSVLFCLDFTLHCHWGFIKIAFSSCAISPIMILLIKVTSSQLFSGSHWSLFWLILFLDCLAISDFVKD